MLLTPVFRSNIQTRCNSLLIFIPHIDVLISSCTIERTLLNKSLARTLIPLFLSGCSQIVYTGKIYKEPGVAPQYIELSCTYRTEDQKGCVDAVRLSGLPNDGKPDKKLNTGIWWVENDDAGEQTVKIQCRMEKYLIFQAAGSPSMRRMSSLNKYHSG
jgi:hypothetical protein